MRSQLPDGALFLAPSARLNKMVQELRARFHVAKWGVFCHLTKLQSSPARLKNVYSDSARKHPQKSHQLSSCISINSNDRPLTSTFSFSRCAFLTRHNSWSSMAGKKAHNKWWRTQLSKRTIQTVHQPSGLITHENALARAHARVKARIAWHQS